MIVRNNTSLRERYSEYTGSLANKSAGNGILDRAISGGGIAGSLALEGESRRDDVKRLTERLKYSPFVVNKSVLFAAENFSKIKRDQDLGGEFKFFKATGEAAVDTFVDIASTAAIILAQAAVNGTGLHLSYTDLAQKNKYLNDSDKYFSDIFSSPNIDNLRDDIDEKSAIKRIYTRQQRELKREPSLSGSRPPLNVKDSDRTAANSYVIKTKRVSLDTLTNGQQGNVDFINTVSVLTVDSTDINDTIPFKIKVNIPGKSQEILYFRAYLENFNDTYTGNWNGTNYIGRAEKVYNYNGFDRAIDFGFKVAASSREEMIPLYQKLNALAGTTAPTYSETFMQGIYVNLTVGEWLIDVPGFFQNIRLSWDKSYPWATRVPEIDQFGQIESLPIEPKVPHILDIGVSFIPIHQFIPQYPTAGTAGLADYIGYNRVKSFTQDEVDEELERLKLLSAPLPYESTLLNRIPLSRYQQRLIQQREFNRSFKDAGL